MRLIVALFALVSLATPALASAQDACGEWSILREEAPPRYSAGVWAGVPLADPYAVERGFDTGLVRMVGTRARVEAFTLESGVVRVLRVRGNCATDDAIDVVVTEDAVFVVHIYGVNAGIFGLADVYRVAGAAALPRVVRRLRALGGRTLEPAVRAALSAELGPLPPE
jgi:hypothetical protein